MDTKCIQRRELQMNCANNERVFTFFFFFSSKAQWSDNSSRGWAKRRETEKIEWNEIHKSFVCVQKNGKWTSGNMEIERWKHWKVWNKKNRRTVEMGRSEHLRLINMAWCRNMVSNEHCKHNKAAVAGAASVRRVNTIEKSAALFLYEFNCRLRVKI